MKSAAADQTTPKKDEDQTQISEPKDDKKTQQTTTLDQTEIPPPSQASHQSLDEILKEEETQHAYSDDKKTEAGNNDNVIIPIPPPSHTTPESKPAHPDDERASLIPQTQATTNYGSIPNQNGGDLDPNQTPSTLTLSAHYNEYCCNYLKTILKILAAIPSTILMLYPSWPGAAFAYFAMSLASNNSQLATAAGVLAYAAITPFNFVKNIQMFQGLYNEFAKMMQKNCGERIKPLTKMLGMEILYFLAGIPYFETMYNACITPYPETTPKFFAFIGGYNNPYIIWPAQILSYRVIGGAYGCVINGLIWNSKLPEQIRYLEQFNCCKPIEQLRSRFTASDKHPNTSKALRKVADDMQAITNLEMTVLEAEVFTKRVTELTKTIENLEKPIKSAQANSSQSPLTKQQLITAKKELSQYMLSLLKYEVPFWKNTLLYLLTPISIFWAYYGNRFFLDMGERVGLRFSGGEPKFTDAGEPIVIGGIAEIGYLFRWTGFLLNALAFTYLIPEAVFKPIINCCVNLYHTTAISPTGYGKFLHRFVATFLGLCFAFGNGFLTFQDRDNLNTFELWSTLIASMLIALSLGGDGIMNLFDAFRELLGYQIANPRRIISDAIEKAYTYMENEYGIIPTILAELREKHTSHKFDVVNHNIDDTEDKQPLHSEDGQKKIDFQNVVSFYQTSQLTIDFRDERETKRNNRWNETNFLKSALCCCFGYRYKPENDTSKDSFPPQLQGATIVSANEVNEETPLQEQGPSRITQCWNATYNFFCCIGKGYQKIENQDEIKQQQNYGTATLP